MNQKDSLSPSDSKPSQSAYGGYVKYEEIAKILKNGWGWITTCKSLADYFEKEEMERQRIEIQDTANGTIQFNKQQFLKQCGVKE